MASYKGNQLHVQGITCSSNTEKRKRLFKNQELNVRDDLRKSGNKLLRERENSSFRATTTSNLTPDN